MKIIAQKEHQYLIEVDKQKDPNSGKEESMARILDTRANKFYPADYLYLWLNSEGWTSYTGNETAEALLAKYQVTL